MVPNIGLSSNRCITATQLADAAKYEGYSAANLQYGKVGWLMYGELPVALPRRKSDGHLIYTCALAEQDDQRLPDEQHWVWKMTTRHPRRLTPSMLAADA
jgi:hypothetical protein